MRASFVKVTLLFFFFGWVTSAQEIKKEVSLEYKIEQSNEKEIIPLYLEFLRSNTKDALKLKSYKDAILQYTAQQNKPILEAETNYLYGLSLIMSGNQKEAKTYFNRCLNIGNLLKIDTLQAKAYYGYGKIELEKSNIDVGLIKLKKANEYLVNYKQSRLKALILNSIAIGYYDKGIIDKSTEYQLKSLNAIAIIGWKEHEISVYNNLAVDFIDQGLYGQATEYLFKALALCEEINETNRRISVLSNISEIYSYQKKYKEAISYLLKAKNTAEKQQNIRKLIFVRNRLGRVYSKQKNHLKALIEFEYVLDKATQFKNEDYITLANVELAILSQKLNLEKEAFYLNNAKNRLEAINSKFFKAYTLCSLGRYYYLINDSKKALSYLKKAFQYRTEINDYTATQDIIKLITKCYEYDQNYYQAYIFSQKHLKVNDSLQRVSYVQGLATKTMKHDFDLTKKDWELNKDKELFIEGQKLKQQTAVTYIVLMVLLIIIIFTVWIYIANGQKQKLNKRLNEKKEKLEKTNTAKNMIFAIIGHDLRTPFTSIKSIIALAEEGIINGENFQLHLNSLALCFHNIESSLNNILLWAKNQMDGIVSHQKDMDLHDNINKTLSFLSHDITRKKTKIICHYSAATSIYCDENQFETIIRNLLSNAIKFTPNQGSITITTSEVNDGVKISISDTGIGMDQKTKNNLFENDRFNTAKFGTNGEKGTGLGLKVCKDFTESNKGTIGCETKIGEGTTFFVVFKVRPIKPSLQISR